MNIVKHKALPCEPKQYRASYMKRLKSNWNKAVSVVSGKRKGFKGRELRGNVQAGTLLRAANELEAYAVRAEMFNPQGRGKELAANFRASIEQFHTDEWVNSRNEIMRASRRGDAEAIEMRSEIIKTTVSNFMFTTSSWQNFFTQVDLPHNGVPYMECNVPQEITVECIGPDGAPRPVRPVKQQEQAPVDLCVLSTPEFVYPTRDLYKGFDVREEALAQVDLTRDLNAQWDVILKQLVLVGSPSTRLKATFTLTGVPDCKKDYHAHSVVDTANFPAGNYVTLSSNGADTTFRQECLDEIIAYVTQWGSGAFSDGDMSVAEIIIPSGDGAGWLDAVTITNNSTGGHTNPAVEQILSTGGLFSYGGHNFTYRYDNTLDPTPGTAYVRMNKPIGTIFTKTSMDDTIIEADSVMKRQYKESIAMTKVYGVGYTSNLTPNIFAIKYRD
jgi:hypothetical protein